jgi:hypothetical protein
MNIVVDGVSDLALKRAEHQRVFASGGIWGLIAEIQKQTERLEADRYFEKHVIAAGAVACNERSV